MSEVDSETETVEEEHSSNKAAKILYRPVGMVGGIVGGIVAGRIFGMIWKRASPTDSKKAPKALEADHSMREIVLAAAIQGAVFAAVKAAIDRGGARAFERWTGEWPGD